MKEYTFYRLPHHVTPGYINSKGEQQVGKIGCTTNYKSRLANSIREGFNITDAYILEIGFYETRKKAEARETELQKQYDCFDHNKQLAVIEKKKGQIAWNKGLKNVQVAWNKGIPNKGLAAKGNKKEIVTCPYCGKEGGGGSMIRWHGDNCPQNPNRSTE